ncbi:MAG: hypothetical protein V4787_26020 [Pseudomonadota bacterium]
MKPLVASFVIASAAPLAWACGVCAEDKMAATYDHAIVQRAAARGEAMVFCELAGPVDVERITAAAARQRGIDRASIRVSSNPPALSFALDSKQLSPQAAAEAIQKASAHGTRVSVLRVGAR